MTRKTPAAVIWALGLTQIVGYGTLYYGFSILAPAMAADFGWPEQWIFGALSASLLAGAIVAPVAGHWADRFGAGRLMTFGSVFAAMALAAPALAPSGPVFVLALVVVEIAASFVLYSTAFAAIVQIGGQGAQRSITHLTLIAGFASTLFWPLTATLHAHLDWREVYFVFAALNLVLCLPIHVWLARFPVQTRAKAAGEGGAQPEPADGGRAIGRPGIFLLMLAGFAIEGFVLSSVLVHMVPLTAALGFGAAGVFVTTLFGPAQVLSRLTNMVFGGRLAQTRLAVIAACLLPVGLGVLLLTSPMLAGGLAFVVLFGLGSGLTSIVGGTLPLELFGRHGYGARLGWVSAARQLSSSVAPFGLSLMMALGGTAVALGWLAAIGALGLIAFAAVAFMCRQPRSSRAELAVEGSRS
ncbi:arsenite efflux MFS transporter ArsK [Mesorhizobium sp. WSM2239]|uniref:Arsenite efflux MFS transporter ArsK n=2 Tax=unclassified Mesorhizobium TaxID=325217 RepID=A0AAU8D3P1_9HYPH